MNIEEKKLEQLIRQRLNDQHTEFNEAHWLSARKLIDADRRRKKRRWLFFAGAFIAVISCIAFLPGIFHEEKTGIKVTPAATGHTNNTNETPSPAITTTRKDVNMPVADQPNPVAKDQTAQGTSSTQTKPLHAVMEKESTVNDQPEEQLHNTSAKNNNQVLSSPVQPAPKPAADARGQAPQSNPAGGAMSHPAKKKTTNRKPATDHDVMAKNGPATGRAIEVASMQEPLADNNPTHHSNEPENIHTRHEKPATLINPKYQSQLAHHWAPAADTSVNIPAPLSPLKARNSFIAQELGATYFNPGKNLAEPLNLSVGLMYYCAVNSKTGVNAGVFYSRIHQNLPARVYSNTSYDFGKNLSYTSIQTQRLDYIEIPLQAYYYPAYQHMVRAGVSYYYLLQSADLVNRSGVQANENGYTDAINKNDLLLSAGYTWFGKAPFHFSLTGYYGLYDISDNRIFGSNQNDRNAGVKLSIGYTLRQLR